MFGYRMPTHVHVEPGCLVRLPEAVRRLGLESVCLVIDKGLAQTGWPDEARRLLEDAGIRIVVFSKIKNNPRTSSVTELAHELRIKEIQGVVALGGGSVLDAAKAAAMLATNDYKIEQYEGKDRYANDPLPMIAIPTTCGTGSEVTWVSVLTHTPTRHKISVKGESMFPNVALVDSELLATLPPNLVAWTGLDALTHAVEATIGTASNPVSDALAEKAIALLFRFLPRAHRKIGTDVQARSAVMRASTFAGLSFSNADVGGVHCLSEAIGGLFDHPHGLLNAMLLEPVLQYHRPHIDERLAQLCGLFSGEAQRNSLERQAPIKLRANYFMQQLSALIDELGVPKFSSLDIPMSEFPLIAVHAARNGSNRSNPQPMAATSYQEILRSLG